MGGGFSHGGGGGGGEEVPKQVERRNIDGLDYFTGSGDSGNLSYCSL